MSAALEREVKRLRALLDRAKRGEKVQKLPLSRGDVLGPGGRVGQFWTPSWCATAFVRWAGVRHGMRVLDCGSGMGALSFAARKAGAVVRAVEVDERLVTRTRPSLERAGIELLHQSILGADRRQTEIGGGGSYDLAISNPPWEKDYPEQFAEAMLLRAPRAGLLLPLNFLCGVERGSFWRDRVVPLRIRALPRRPVFAEDAKSGGMRDVIFLEIERRRARRGALDEDLVRIGVGE